MRWRTRRNFSPWSLVSSLPSTKTEPEVAGSSWTITRPSVDLPEPDSPTSPSVSPAWMSKLTPSTACTTWLPKRPAPTGKCLTTSWTRTSTPSLLDGTVWAGISVVDFIFECVAHQHPATRFLARSHLVQRRFLAKAALDAEAAARIELATGGQVRHVGRKAANVEQAIVLQFVDPWLGA